MGDESTLYVGGLAKEVTEDHLHELFLQAGPLDKVTRAKEKDGSFKTYAFVDFVHPESVPYAIQVMDGIKLFNQHLRLKGRTASQTPHDASPTHQSDSRHHGYHRSKSDDRRRGPSVPSALIPNHSKFGRSTSGSDRRGNRGFNGPDNLSMSFSGSAAFSPANMQPQSFEDRRNRLLQKQNMSSSYQAHYQGQYQGNQGGYNNYGQNYQGWGGNMYNSGGGY